MKLIEEPSVVKAAGNKTKLIEEFFGLVAGNQEKISIAKMNSPMGWEEPGQTPDFDEFTIVLTGKLKVQFKHDVKFVEAGQAFYAEKGKWVKYSTPFAGGCEYISVCMPPFSPDSVNRDEEI